MPKKRHQTRYSKPQSTAPSSLSIGPPSSLGASSNTDDPSESRGVNQLLADLRRTAPGAATHRPTEPAPTLPPAIRSILQLPEAPPLRPRRHDRRTAGPPAPRSWLSAASRSASLRKMQQYDDLRSRDHRPLPGQRLPDPGSLMDVVLKQFALDWAFQREYNHYLIYDLPTHVRMSLLSYLSLLHPDGISLDDLRVLLLPPSDDSSPSPALNPTLANDTFTHLDLTNALSHRLTLPSLSRFLSPAHTSEDLHVQESWDDDPPSTASIPTTILPTLTHLSLEIPPSRSHAASWRHLLPFVARTCPSLTHLSLAYWPRPCLTPGAELATVVSPLALGGREVAYSGTGAYSHSLDNDYSEAVLLLRRLSKTLYGLEFLDLTGCGEWAAALWRSAGGGGGGECVDWVGDWGKVERVRLGPGYTIAEDAEEGERAAWEGLVGVARGLEREVRARRRGRGRVGLVVEDGTEGGDL
ncbi:hypothetical protein QBC39DRAFT_296048 [Podospora conica]|nr:hypothetical protein QBC39DRAFT_296048 [Schizothecium conicum]